MSEKIFYVHRAQDFGELLTKSEGKPVLLDFWAEWCGPCKAMNPVFERLSESQDDVIIAKVDVDEVQELAIAYGVQAIPTMISFKNREEIGNRIVGAAPQSFVEEHMKEMVKA